MHKCEHKTSDDDNDASLPAGIFLEVFFFLPPPSPTSSKLLDTTI